MLFFNMNDVADERRSNAEFNLPKTKRTVIFKLPLHALGSENSDLTERVLGRR